MQGVTKAALASVLVLASATPAFAGEPPPPTAAAARSSEKLALAHQIIVASGGEAQMRAKLVALMGAANQLRADVIPASARVTTTEIMSEVQSSFLEVLPQVITLAEQAYADNLTEQEMRDYVGWLSSESGRAIRDKSTAISTQVIVGEGPLLREMMPRLIEKAIDRACARGECSAQDRTTIAAAVAKAMQKG